jgi:NADPH-dependent glutamate synthase beta subunit-like oxidoreductase
VVNGGATVVQAVAEGKKAAQGIHGYLSGKNDAKKRVKK